MADKKITQLTNITGANLVNVDEFVVVDISADETKAITFGELKEAFDTSTGFVRITGDTMTGNLTVPNIITSGNVDGRDISTDGTKLDGIESGATADQTPAQIKTAYESNADTNEFSDAEQTKLAGIEANATTDQTAAQIKTAYESNADTNEFSDAEQTKLAGIEASADVTDATNVAAAGAAMTSNNLSDLASATTARTNLGLGTAATTAATDYTAKTSATGSSVLATGTTAQRDSSPSAGMLRFNSSDTSFEGYTGSGWTTISTTGGGAGTLLAVNNLSDVNSAATSRTNLDVDQAGTALALAIALG